MKTMWVRTVYFLVGALFTPLFLGLAVLLLWHPPQNGSHFIVYGSSALFCFLAIVTGSAFRAVFRNPPWWIIHPEQTRNATLLVLRSQMVGLAKKRLKLAEQNAKVAEQAVKVAERIEELEKAETLGRDEPPPGASP